MNFQLIEELKTLKQEHKDLQQRFNKLYNANEQKKQDNFELRAENRSLKKKNYELTILVDTFLKTKKRVK